MFLHRRRPPFNTAHSNRRKRRTHRLETLEARRLLAAEVINPLHNYAMPADVDQSGYVSARDALMVINQINRDDGRPVSGEPSDTEDAASKMKYDVSNDNMITARDALMVINTMNASSALVASADAIGGSLGTDLAEGNATEWSAHTDGPFTFTLADSDEQVTSGTQSLRFDTDSQFNTGVHFPADASASWDLSEIESLSFDVFTDSHTDGFQDNQPRVQFLAPGGSIVLTPNQPISPDDGAASIVVPVEGDSIWTKAVFGTPDLSQVNQFKIFHDSGGTGFTLFLDNVTLNPIGPGIIVEHSDEDTVVSETDRTDTVMVQLANQPTGDVVIEVAASDSTEISFPANQLTFTSEDWDTPQSFVIAGVDDEDADGNVVSDVTFSVASNSATEYLTASNQTINVTTLNAARGEMRVTGARVVDGNFQTLPSPMPGEEFGVIVSYETLDLSADAFYDISVYLDGIAMTDSRTFGAGQGQSFYFTTPRGHFARPGTHTLDVVVDAGDHVQETDETNNSLQFSFTTAPYTDLPQKFVFPLGGEPNVDWAFYSYLDVDPRFDHAADFESGPFQFNASQGYDINNPHFAAMDRGIPVFAAADGVVTDVRDHFFDRGFGGGSNYITINHGDGWQTRYLNLAEDSLTIQVGDTVLRGQTIAMQGGSDADPGRLHFDVKRFGRKVEPMLAPEIYFVDPPQYQGDQSVVISDLLITNDSLFASSDWRERASEVTEFSTTGSDPIFLNYYFTHANPGDVVAVNWKRPDGTIVETDGFTFSSVGRQQTFQWVLDSDWRSHPGTWTVEVNSGDGFASTAFDVVTGDAAPEIRVRHNNLIARDGRITPYDFGSVAPGDEAPTKVFTIANHGGGNLTLGEPSLPEGFSLVGEFPNSIPSGTSVDVTLQLDTDVVGRKYGEIRFTTNDADESSYDFILEGVVTGSLPAGSPTLTGTGPSAINFEFGEPPPHAFANITVNDASVSFENAKVHFHQVAGGTANDMLSIRTQGNGAGEVSVTGNDVRYQGILIGSLSIESPVDLSVTFNAGASDAAVQAVLGSLAWSTIDTDSTRPRTVAVSYTNADGQNSGSQYREIVLSPSRLILEVERPGGLVAREGGFAIGKLSRTGDLSQPMTVTLTSDDTSEAVPPTTVEFAAGQRTIENIFIDAINDGITDGEQVATITASAAGIQSANAPMEVADFDAVSFFTVVNSNDSGPGSLRQAMLDANNSDAPASIGFDIPASDPGWIDVDGSLGLDFSDPEADVVRIQPTSPLPVMANHHGYDIVLDGTNLSSLGNNPYGPDTEIDGTLAGGSANGFTVLSNAVTISNLTVNRFARTGVYTEGDITTLAGVYNGVDPTGTIDAGNGSNGVNGQYTSHLSIVPGAWDSVISGNQSNGVSLFRSEYFSISGAKVGVSADGNSVIANGGDGVRLSTIDQVDISNNIISGNGIRGIYILDGSSNILIGGNLVGTSSDGSLDLGNGDDGVGVFNSSNVNIGGLGLSRNVVAGNGAHGISVSELSSVDIVNNYVGIGTDGETDLENTGHGIRIRGVADANIEKNVSSGNQTGVFVENTNATFDLHEWDIADGGNDHTYLFSKLPLGWEVASKIAELSGGHLVTISNAEENAFITDQISGQQHWIGLNDFENEGDFRWSNGEGLDFTNWASGEPSNSSNVEHTAVIRGNGQWNDAYSYNAQPFVIEFDDQPNSSLLAELFSGVSIVDNKIGTNAPGQTEVPNHTGGIQWRQSASGLIHGNVISGNTQHGLWIDDNSRDLVVTGNLIGTNSTGTQPLGNTWNGILVSGSSDIRIGGILAGESNLVSANSLSGIALGTSDRLSVVGNVIGTDVTGQLDFGNHDHGVFAPHGTTEIVIGGTTSDHGNLISGNGGVGVFSFEGLNHTISNNLIGTDATGTTAIANDLAGINVQRTLGVTIEQNAVSGNTQQGIIVSESRFAPEVIHWQGLDGGNDHHYILLSTPLSWLDAEAFADSIGGHLADISGADENAFLTSQFGSSSPWIGLSDFDSEGTFTWSSGLPYDPDVFRGFSEFEPNGGTRENHAQLNSNGTWNDLPNYFDRKSIIEFTSAPDLDAIRETLGGVEITRNLLGVGLDGTNAIVSESDGIEIAASDNVRITENTIANHRIGIDVFGDESSVTIHENSIYANSLLGIDLGSNGPTSNDDLDADEGPNGFQNFPILTHVIATPTQTLIEGTLSSQPNTEFVVDFYSSNVTTPGEAEGQHFLLSQIVLTDSDGNAAFSFDLPDGVPGGHHLTATATDSDGNTSEFSAAIVTENANLVAGGGTDQIARRGSPLSDIPWTVTNTQATKADTPWMDRLYLSIDTTLDDTDVLLSQVARNTVLMPTESYSPLFSAEIPETTATGNYHLLFVVDARNDLAETNETDNIASVSLNVTQPDLVPSGTVGVNFIAPLQFGDDVSVSWTVQNTGIIDTLTGLTDRLWFSSDTLLDESDVLLGEFTTDPNSPVLAGQPYSNSAIVQLPLVPGVTEGDYHVILQSDAEDAATELNETNNVLASSSINVALPQLADLSVSQVTVSQLNLTPETEFDVFWQLSNQGNLAFGDVLNEQVFLSTDNFLGNDFLLDTFSFDDLLGVGESVARSARLTLPPNTPTGDLHLIVMADSENVIVELDETNNASVGPAQVNVPHALTLTIPVDSIAEESGGEAVRGIVTRNGDISQALTVSLVSSDTTELTVPPSVTIASGQSSVAFPIDTVADSIVDADQTAIITATATGFQSSNRSIEVLDSDRLALSLVVPNQINEGDSERITVSRGALTSEPLDVTLTSSSPDHLSPAFFVTIPANATSTTVNLTAISDTQIEGDLVYSLIASAIGLTSTEASLTVLDDDVPTLGLELTRDIVSESDGPTAVYATVTQSLVSDRNVNVLLSSSDSTEVALPDSIIIPPGSTTATFPIGVTNDPFLDGEQQLSIIATVATTDQGLGIAESSVEQTLTVTDDDGPTLLVEIDRDVVREGLEAATGVTVRRLNGLPSDVELVVAMFSSDISEITLPESVTIAADVDFVTLTLDSIEDGQTDGSQVVVVSATAANYTTGRDTIVVTDTELPELKLSQFGVPTTALTDQRIAVTTSITNEGLTSVNRPFVQSFYLSDDSLLGDDILVGEYEVADSIGVNETTASNELFVQLPNESGNYWLIAVTDSTESIDELLESNNVQISNRIEVGSSVAATVSTNTETATAGTAIPIQGSAVNSLNGEPAANSDLEVHILLQGTRRRFPVKTDANGDFQFTFRPLASEAGLYSIAVSHPGDAQPEIQDSFRLLGFAAPRSIPNARVIATGDPATGSVVVGNLGDESLFGIEVEVINASSGLAVNAAVGDADFLIGSNGTATLDYSVTASSTAQRISSFTLRVTSDEGARVDIPITVDVIPLATELSISPTALNVGVVRGTQRLVEVEVTNVGGSPSQDLSLKLPRQLYWLTPATSATIPSIAPGETAKLSLLLSPDAALDFVKYSGTLVLSSEAVSTSIPFSINVVADGTGDLEIEVEDEYTYFTPSAPRVADATIELIDKSTGQLAHTIVTGSDGRAKRPDIAAGFYDMRVYAEGHRSSSQTIQINTGETLVVKPFLPRQLVDYTFSVVPTEIEDRTTINVETTFETNVPAPVVVIEPRSIDFATLEFRNGIAQIDFTVSNFGLIAAEDVVFSPPTHPDYIFTSPITDIGLLPANTALTLPVAVRDIDFVATLSGNILLQPFELPAQDVIVSATNEQTSEIYFTTSDSRGRYFFEGLPDGIYSIAGDDPNSSIQTVRLTSNSVPIVPSLQIDVNSLAQGTIKNEEGSVITDATLTVWQDGTLVGSTTSDANGDYLLPLDAEGDLEFVFESSGYARLEVLQNVETGLVTVLNVGLERESIIEGSVSFDGAASPLADSVQFAATHEESGQTFPGLLNGNRFLFSGLPRGTYSLTLAADGFAARQFLDVILDASQTLDLGSFVIALGQTVSGTLVGRLDDVDPANVVVSLLRDGVAAQLSNLTSGFEFEFDQVAAGDYSFAVSGLAEGRFEVADGLAVHRGIDITDFRISLVDGGRIEGLLTVGVNSVPLPYTEISLNRDGEIVGEASSDASGSFLFGNLRPGQYQLRVADLKSSTVTNVNVISGETQEPTVQVEAPVLGFIKGSVRNGSGEPVLDSQVVLLKDGFAITSALVDSQGSYSIPLFQTGEFQLHALSLSTSIVEQVRDLSVANGETIVADFSSDDQRFEVTVVFPSDTEEDSENLVVHARSASGETVFGARQEGGVFDFHGIPDGLVTIIASNQKDLIGERTIDIEAAVGKRFSLDLIPSARLEGQLRTDVQSPRWGDAVLQISTVSGETRYAVAIDEDGRYETPQIIPGNYVLTVTGSDFVPFSQSISLVAGRREQDLAVAVVGSRISGTVNLNDQTGGDVRVYVRDGQGNTMALSTADENGDFSFVTDQDNATLVVLADGYLPVEFQVDALQSSNALDEIELLRVSLPTASLGENATTANTPASDSVQLNSSATSSRQSAQARLLFPFAGGFFFDKESIFSLFDALFDPSEHEDHVDDVHQLPSDPCYASCKGSSDAAEESKSTQDQAFERYVHQSRIVKGMDGEWYAEGTKWFTGSFNALAGVVTQLGKFKKASGVFRELKEVVDFIGKLSFVDAVKNQIDSLGSISNAETAGQRIRGILLSLSDLRKDTVSLAGFLDTIDVPKYGIDGGSYSKQLEALKELTGIVEAIEVLTIRTSSAMQKLANLSVEIEEQKALLEQYKEEYENAVSLASVRNNILEDCIERIDPEDCCEGPDCSDDKPCEASGGFTFTIPCGPRPSINVSINIFGINGDCPPSPPSQGSDESPTDSDDEDESPTFHSDDGILSLLSDCAGFGGGASRSARSALRQGISTFADEPIGLNGVCAAVRSGITRSVVVTRDAFDANLGLRNNLGGSPLEDVEFDISISTIDGSDASHLFGIRAPEIRGFSKTEAGVELDDRGTGNVRWTIIPSVNAAPETAMQYFVGGMLSYLLDGIEVEIQFARQLIRVLPGPELHLEYFQERDVYADDPFTPEVEPSIPYSLGLIISNQGAGAARNLRIESGQPRIIENEKGLDTNFSIIGTEVNGVSATPSLSISFGNLASDHSAVAQWIFTTPLQGHFFDFDATYTHQDSIDTGVDISLIRSVEIFETAQVVRADREDEDGKPDFLTDDIEDAGKLPDTLHLSDGSTELVGLASNPSIDGTLSSSNLQVELSADMTDGWSYLRMPDPSDGLFRVVHVVRSDGTAVPSDNFWQTDRTFAEVQTRPVYEDILHLLDKDSDGEYTIFYAPLDENPPTIASIQEVSPDPTISAVDSLLVTFSEPIDAASVGVDDFVLSRDGGLNVLDNSATIEQVSSNEFRVGFGSLTALDGDYLFFGNASGITDTVGNPGVGFASERWIKGEFGAAVRSIDGVPGSSLAVPFDRVDVVFTKQILPSTFGFADIELSRNGEIVEIDSQVTILAIGSDRFRLVGLSEVTQVPGDYELRINARGVTDADGLPGVGSNSVFWTLDMDRPRIETIIGPGGSLLREPVDSIDIQFSKPIDATSLSVDDVTITHNGTGIVVPEDVDIEPVEGNRFRVTGLGSLNSLDGEYTITVGPEIIDLVGNELAETATVSWIVDRTAPQALVNLRVIPNSGLPSDDDVINTRDVKLVAMAAEPGLTIEVFDETTSELLASELVSGQELELPLRLSSGGINRLLVSIVDEAGNSTENRVVVFVDESNPVIVEIQGTPPSVTTENVDSLRLVFSEPVDTTLLDSRAVQLTRDGVPVDVSDTVTLESTSDVALLVSGLGQSTSLPGDYELSLNISSVRDVSGNAGVVPTQISWTRERDREDRTAPASHVDALPQRYDSKSIMVSVTGDDPLPADANEVVSGVLEYDVYVADDSGPFTPWITLSADEPMAEFEGESDHTYYFRSIARDVAGNVETKPISIEAHTYVPDLDAPQSSVTSVNSDMPEFVVEFQATDVSGSQVTEIRVYVEVDGVPATLPFAVVSPGTPDSSGVVRGSVSYHATADGLPHEYRFYTVAIDGSGNVEPAPASGGPRVTAQFDEPTALVATSLDVQNGLTQRSYIRNLDVQFNTDTGLQALLDTLDDDEEANNRLQLKRFATDGSGPGIDVSLSGKATRVGSQLSIDLGTGGIGGNALSNVGNGYYRLFVDEDGDGDADRELNFYRLYGDVNGDRIVDILDVTDIARAFSERTNDPNSDINGDGKVNSLDRAFAQKQTRISADLRTIDSALHLDD